MIDALTAVDHLRVEHDKNINGLAFCIFKVHPIDKVFSDFGSAREFIPIPK